LTFIISVCHDARSSECQERSFYLCVRLCLVNKSLSRRGPQIFLFCRTSRPSVVYTQHPLQWAPGTSSPAVERPGLEADCLRASSVEICNEWDCTSASSTCLGVYIDRFGRHLYLYLSNCPYKILA